MVQYIFAKTKLYFFKSTIHQTKEQLIKNSKTFKIIYRMRLKLLTNADKIPACWFRIIQGV